MSMTLMDAIVNIGTWRTRQRSGKAHLVESMISGDWITRCGRRLHDEPTRRGGDVVLSVFGTPKCRQCSTDPES